MVLGQAKLKEKVGDCLLEKIR